MQDEILDLVNDRDEVIGKIPRTEAVEKGLRNVRVINAFIVNDTGMLWIPRRNSNKKSLPNALDMSVGGYVTSGETYEESFRRESQEELNLDINTVQWHDLGSMNPHDHNTNAFMRVYEIRSNIVPSFNPDDFSEGTWIAPQELCDRIAQGEYAKGDLPIIVRHFYQVQ